MKSKLWPLILSLTLLLTVESALQAKDAEYICVPIPERAANPARDPFNGDIPAANIQVRVEGKHHKHRPTIVFIHGFAENITEWNCNQSALSDKYLTIAFDLRGYGRSSKTPAPYPPSVPPPSGEINYTMQVFADDINAVLTELGVSENIILVGRSIGGGIALNYATTYPGVRKLVSVAGSPQYFADCSMPLAPCITTSSPDPFPNCSSCVSTCCNLYPANFYLNNNPLCCIFPKSLQFAEIIDLETEECIESCPIGDNQCPIDCVLNLFVIPYVINETCTNPSLATLQQNYATTLLLQEINPATTNILSSTIVFASSQDQRNLVPLINVPTLLCAGTIDEDVDPRNSLYMHQRIRGSILAEFIGKGHELNLTDVSNFNRLLAGFICGKNYCKFLQVGNANSCDVCTSALTLTDFSECTPVATATQN